MMRTIPTRRLFLAFAMGLTLSLASANTSETDVVYTFSPSNADLLAVTPSCTLWATTTPNVGTREQMMSHAWRFNKTTYYVVGHGTTNCYSTVYPFHDKASVSLSRGGSILVASGSVLLSRQDAATATNLDWLARVAFEADSRNLDGLTFDLEAPRAADAVASTGSPLSAPAKILTVKTSRKTGCRIPLYNYAVTNVSTWWRHDDWKRTWPVRRVGDWMDRMVIWDGRDWQEVLLNSLTRVVACITIDYMYDDGNHCIRWCRLNYGLEDDGSRGISKHMMYTDTIVSGYVLPAPAVPPLESAGVREAEEILKTLPPSTGEGLTNWMVRITDSGDPRIGRTYIRTYPCAAVPAKVMRLLELMGGFQYEAKEILKPEVPKPQKN